MIDKSQGEISLFGLTHENNPNQIQKLIGFCTQYNIIFEYLTVYEHLKMYAKIKGVKGNIDTEIE